MPSNRRCSFYEAQFVKGDVLGVRHYHGREAVIERI